MTRSPAVGVCTAVERARYTVWEETIAFVPRSYARAIHRADALPLLIPPYESEALASAPVEDVLSRLDALILAGGSDVDPHTYGAERADATGTTWADRDEFEVALTRAALDHGMPVLGICRGMQLLNVALGGTLVQHLPDAVGHSEHLHTPGAFGDHRVRLEPGSLAARAAGAEELDVKSHHHQGLDRLGDGLRATGWAEDGTVEAVELPDADFALGVLWHPEEDGRSGVIGSLVETARSAAPGREAEAAAQVRRA